MDLYLRNVPNFVEIENFLCTNGRTYLRTTYVRTDERTLRPSDRLYSINQSISHVYFRQSPYEIKKKVQ